MEQLPEQAISEFIELFREIYGVDLDPEEAAFRARNFLNLYAAVLGDFGTAGTQETLKTEAPP
ncbi:hypothetical protein EXS56_02220 [Candidatus Kaiserbacteria bacterium]|nr:hypothetical protein [Candidatus Kaiserbacteria bacterium]